MSRFEFGEYRTLVLLGAGGMGRAYLARSGSGRLVVVKVMHAHLAAEPLFRERLRREVQAARAMTGPFTAAVLDAEPQAPLPWLAVEYCAGPTLSEAVAGYGPLAAGDLASLGAALAEALTAIHTAGLVHRDLKPANVLVTGQGPRVIDFGIAKALGDGPASGSSDEALTGAGTCSAPSASWLRSRSRTPPNPPPPVTCSRSGRCSRWRRRAAIRTAGYGTADRLPDASRGPGPRRRTGRGVDRLLDPLSVEGSG